MYIQPLIASIRSDTLSYHIRWKSTRFCRLGRSPLTSVPLHQRTPYLIALTSPLSVDYLRSTRSVAREQLVF